MTHAFFSCYKFILEEHIMQNLHQAEGENEQNECRKLQVNNDLTNNIKESWVISGLCESISYFTLVFYITLKYKHLMSNSAQQTYIFVYVCIHDRWSALIGWRPLQFCSHRWKLVLVSWLPGVMSRFLLQTAWTQWWRFNSNTLGCNQIWRWVWQCRLF